MIWIRIIAKLLAVLRDGATPAQIAGGLVLGMAFGLVPGWPVQVWVLLGLILILRVNLGMAMVGWMLAGALAWLLDPALDALGESLLRAGALQGVWTALYNVPPWALTRFNNTVVMGTMAAALVAGPLLFPLLVWAVKAYRERFLARLNKFRLVQALMGSRFYGWYRKVADTGLIG